MKIKDPEKVKMLNRALAAGGNLHTLEDIEAALQSGDMQSHSEGDTWVITEIADFPQRRLVNVLYVIGNLEGAFATEEVVEKWARKIGADAITALGRTGWERHQRQAPGWKIVGTFFTKEL